MNWTKSEFEIDTDPNRIDHAATHAFLSRSYWAEGRSLEAQTRANSNSICFGLYHRDRQIGLARVVTDHATFAYLCDVYVLEEFRGQGLGSRLMETALAFPELKNLKWTLRTRDAHDLYRKFGFDQTNPERNMTRLPPPV